MHKKIFLAALLSVAGLFSATAHADGWLFHMNVFENDAGSPGAFQFGSGWAPADMKTTLLQSNVGTYFGDQLRLEPNFNTYANAVASGDPGELAYWTDGAGGGNKFMEANTYIEVGTIATPTASFSGTVDSYTLDSAYDGLAFIKVLNPATGWSLDLFETYDLSLLGSFALSADLSAHQGKVLQYGFLVSGLNANPDDILGNADVSVIPEPSTYAAIFGGLALLGALAYRRRAGK
ncbi:MAG: PEP-CTERM sorting domain-containing protein [Opitutales bacterium]